MKYHVDGYKSYRIDDDGSMELMANFVASIDKEVRYVDGLTSKTVLTISGETPDTTDATGQLPPLKLPPVEIAAEDFPGLSWVMPNWGVRAIIRPGAGVKEDLRTMIQVMSAPAITTVYKQTGWQVIGSKRVYLHAGGGISAKGNDKAITVRLPPELAQYNLVTTAPPRQGVLSSLALVDLCDHGITWPLLAGCLTPLYGAVDFAIHLTGRTGSFKSECMSLFQSHYGAGMDARHLPGSWSSTPNALEALAFFAANAAFVIDDFVPSGTSWQQRAYQQNADKIIRAQGNQSGRARLTDTAALQQTMYPRGIILSTGEDTPEGHSVRARMLILEIAAGDIDADDLSTAQALRTSYPATVAWLAQSLAEVPPSIQARTEQLRAQYRSMGHSRTPGMLGRLVATAEDFLARAAGAGLITQAQQLAASADAKKSIELAGSKQQAFLEDADPVDVFQAAIRQVLASGGGHLRTLNGGVPAKAEIMGWSKERSIGEMATFKSRGPCIGWVKVPTDELFVDITSGYNIIRKAAGQELTLSKQTLFKRLKDAGTLPRVDEARGRNTIRVTAENHPRQVLCLSLSTALQTEDTTDGEDESTSSGDGAADDSHTTDASGGSGSSAAE